MREKIILNAVHVPSVYLISDRHAHPSLSLTEALRAAISGGVRMVQLREKDLDDDSFASLAHTLRKICSDGGARLIINRRLPLALEAQADGLHIGSDSIPDIPGIKAAGGADFLVGVSTHSVHEAEQAQKAGADFVTLGPAYPTPSKKGMGEALGAFELGRGARSCCIPVFALGGVRCDRIAELHQAGVKNLAMIRAILAAEDPAPAAVEIIERLEQLDD